MNAITKKLAEYQKKINKCSFCLSAHKSKIIFQIELYHKPSEFIALYPSQTLAELHQAVQAAILSNDSSIPKAQTLWRGDFAADFQYETTTIHDIFAYNNSDKPILSIPCDEDITLTEMIKHNNAYFRPTLIIPIRTIYKIYVIDQTYILTQSANQRQLRSKMSSDFASSVELTEIKVETPPPPDTGTCTNIHYDSGSLQIESNELGEFVEIDLIPAASSFIGLRRRNITEK